MNICDKWKECDFVSKNGHRCNHYDVHKNFDQCSDHCPNPKTKGCICHQVTPKEEVLLRLTGKI